MVKKILLFGLAFLFSVLGFTQNPGNVGTTNLSAWFKPDGLTIGNVSTWTTTFPTGVNALSVSDAATPYPQATRTPAGNISNYNTTIYFNNANSNPNQVLTNNSISNLLENRYTGDEGTFFLAYYYEDYVGKQNDHFVTYNDGLDAIQLRNLGANGRCAIGIGAGTVNACRNWPETHAPAVISYKGNRSGSSTMSFFNHSYLWTTSSASGSSGANGLYIGVKPTGGGGLHGNSGLKGYIHEVIFYDADLTNAEMHKVHSYLAIKYGSTLYNTGGGAQGDYTATTGALIWDASVGPTYHNDVIGIGRDDTQGLLQKQSHSFDDVTRVYLDSLMAYNTANNGSFTSNVSYVVVGSNNGSMCSSSAANSEVPSGFGLTERLTREWKVQNTNCTDSINFDLTTLNCPSFNNASCLRLLIDDDGNFSNASVYASGNGLDISNNGGVITVRGVSNALVPMNSTRYFTIAVVEPPLDLGADTTICPGDTITLDGTIPNGTYLWQDASTNATYQATSTNQYWVEVDVNGCVVSDSIQISPGPTPIVNLGGDTNICVGDTIFYDAFHPASTYLWSDGSTDSVLKVYSTGMVWVEVTNGCGTTIDTVNVTVNNYPMVSLGNDTILCDGDTLGLDVYQPGASYNWSTGQQDSAIFVWSTGTVWVDLTLNTCTSRDSILATFNPVPIVDLGPDTSICVGDTLGLQSLTAGATYLWQDNSTDSIFKASVAGAYWVNVTLANCSASDTMNLSITQYPVVNLGPDVVACDGDQFYLDAYNVGATYLWNDGTNSNTILVTQADTYWVDVTVNKCHSYDTVVFQYNPIPIIDLGNDTLICDPDILVLDATYPGASYNWNIGSTLPTINVNGIGQYIVTVTSLNCSFSDSISVTVEPKPLADLGVDTILCTRTSFRKGNVVTGAGYLWQDGSVNAFYDITSPGTYWVEVTKGHCFNSDTLVVEEANVVSVELGNDTLVCVGDVIELTAGSDTANSDTASYLWSTGSIDSTIWITEAGLYWVDVTNICGTVSDSVEYSYTTLPQIDLGPDTLMCLGDVLDVDAYWYNATDYLWFDGSELSYFSIYEDGEYLVQVTNLCGAIEDTIEVEFIHCECNIFIPTAFTPNGDGLDETFGPETVCELKAYNFYVYDRWGKEIFSSLDQTQKWDGTLDGEPVNSGVYTYILKYNFKKKGPRTDYEVKYGTVTVIR